MDFLEMAWTDDAQTSDTTAVTVGIGGAPRSDATSVTVRASSLLTMASTESSHADIDAVTVSVAGEDSAGIQRDPLATADLSLTQGVWTGTLAGLPVQKELTFTAQAFDRDEQEILNGTHVTMLDGDGEEITVVLRSVDEGEIGRLPIITAITVEPVDPNQTADVTVTVQGSDDETLEYRFSGGTFDPASGDISLSAGEGTLTSSYQAPDAAGQYLARLSLRNDQGHGTEVGFRIQVGEQPGGATSTISADVAPVVHGITGRRSPVGVVWTADASAADNGELTFAWSFSGTETFRDATTNPAILQGYVESTTGTLSVTVTDGDGLSTTTSLELTAGMFPDALQPSPAELVINEVDYDTPGSDDAEFVEIHNPGSDPVDLADYRLELVNGNGGGTYGPVVSLSGQLAAGSFHVIADAQFTEDIQNGPDAIRIVHTTGRVVDAVHYEGEVAGVGEGSPAPKDTESKSIGRCPDGFDSDENSLDFRTMPASPGTANTCS